MTRRDRARRAWRRDRTTVDNGARDRGFSTVEIIAAIVLIGIVMVPIMTAVIATIRTSSIASDLSNVETVVQNAADRVNRAPMTCNYTAYAQAAAQTQGWNPDRGALVARHYVPAAMPTQQGTWADGACVGDSPTDLLVQMVTITVTSPNGNVSRTVEVIKSDDV